MMTTSDLYKVGGGMLLGAAIGTTIGVLFAPKSGRETRQEIKENVEAAQEKTEAMIASTKDKAQHMYEEGREAIVEKKDWVLDKIESGREAIAGHEGMSGNGEHDKAKPKKVATAH